MNTQELVDAAHGVGRASHDRSGVLQENDKAVTGVEPGSTERNIAGNTESGNCNEENEDVESTDHL